MGCWSSVPNEVVPGLWIGNVRAAQDREQLLKAGITHVVDVSAMEYPPQPGLVYLRLPIPDEPEFDIRQILGQTNAFIRAAALKRGSVLVHCRMGVSRSAAVVLSYVMAYGRASCEDALRLLSAARPVVNPNRGFMRQLQLYEKELAEFRKRNLPRSIDF